MFLGRLFLGLLFLGQKDDLLPDELQAGHPAQKAGESEDEEHKQPAENVPRKQMETLAELLHRRITELGYKGIKECARKSGLPYELLRKTIVEEHLPKDSTLISYAEQLGMDARVLLTATYRQKAPAFVRDWFEELAQRASPAHTSEVQAPVLGRAACGSWLESDGGEPEAYEPVNGLDEDAFFVIAEGDSMSGGHIPSGALLLVSPRAQVNPGDIVLARRGSDEFTVKVYDPHADGSVSLHPLNEAFESLQLSANDPLLVLRITEARIQF